jgi:8-oxo-dGTP diphosphatase
MWLFTPEGFFSVVTAQEFGEELQVRARSADDLARLRQGWFPDLGPTVSIPHRDYPCRAFCTRTALAACLARIAESIDYGNFKDAVATRHSRSRAGIYHHVWADCRQIEDEAPVPESKRHRGAWGAIAELEDRTEEYLGRDLHGEGIWPRTGTLRYGGAVFDLTGRILLREPAKHFDRYVWTFPKGGADPGESAPAAALREVREETGFRPQIVGHVPDAFVGGTTGWRNYFYVMRCHDDAIDPNAFDAETWNVRWADEAEARELIAQTENTKGRERDVRILQAAYAELDRLLD